MNLKSNRNDPIFEFNSDCLKYAPLIVFEHLTCLIKRFFGTRTRKQYSTAGNVNKYT